MTQDFRAPQAFVLDDEPPSKSKTAQKPKIKSPTLIFETEPNATPLVPFPNTPAAPPRRRFRWLSILIAAAFALVMMWAGLAVTQLVESFFVRSPWLGWFALGLAALLALSALAIMLREILGLMRLNKIEALQETASRAINLDEQKSADRTVAELETIYADRQDLAWGLAQLANHRKDILDPSDRVHLAERLLMTPLDEAAQKIIARRARRVTLLTTVTPAAALDILFVATQNLGMIREIATLYGGKPSTLATWRLARMVITHLAIAGGLSLSDSFIQHFIGKGLLGRLSARFGEGAVNGILTARIGLATASLCRPIPKKPDGRETLTSLLREVFNFESGKEITKPSDYAKGH